MDSFEEEMFQHSIQAEGILLVLFVAFASELLAFLINKFAIELKPDAEELELTKRIVEIEREAREYNLPATFMTWAKMKRESAKLEKEVLKKQEARRIASGTAWRQMLQKALRFRAMVSFVLVFFVVEPMLVPAPLLEFSTTWMWPYSRLLALPNYTSGALSCVGWMFLCQRVFARWLAFFK